MHIATVATHPIQYQAPLYRLLHARDAVKLTAVFLSDHSISGGIDKGFGQSVKWDVPLLNGYDSIFLENDGPGNNGSGFRSYRSSNFTKVLKKIKPDVVFLHGHFVLVYWQALFAAKRLKIPVIVRPDSMEGTGIKRSLPKLIVQRSVTNLFYRNANAFCWSGHFSKQDAYRYGFKDDQLFFSPHCIDTQLFEKHLTDATRHRDSLRKSLGFREDQLVIIYVAKFVPLKNHALIYRALGSLPKEIQGNYAVLAIGSGPSFDVVKNLAKEFKNITSVFPGFANQSELASYYAAADTAVMPSNSESWGLAVNEAMTCGLPVAVSDRVGCRKDLAMNGETGFVFEDNNHLELAAILAKWHNNRVLLKQMGENAKEHIASYSSNNAAEGIYNACLHVTYQSKL